MTWEEQIHNSRPKKRAAFVMGDYRQKPFIVPEISHATSQERI